MLSVYFERELLRDFRQIRDSSFGFVEGHHNEVLKEFSVLHQIPVHGPVPPRLPQHGLDRHQPLAMS